MEFYEVINARYSVRKYRNDPVAPDKLQRILEAARLAPTAVNRQPFRVYVLSTRTVAEDLRRIYDRDWFVEAPLVVGITCLHGQGWVRKDGKDFGDIDTAIVMDHLILAAAAEGLGTCWIGAFNAAAARVVLGLEQHEEPIAFTPLGYGAADPPERKRNTLNDLVRWIGLDPPF